MGLKVNLQPSFDLEWLKPSATTEAPERVEKMQKEGKDVIDLTRGQPEPPDFITPEGLKMGAIEALRKNKTGYTPTAGIWELREKIAEELSEELGVKYGPEEIAICPGGRGAIHVALEVIIDIYSHHDWVSYTVPAWSQYLQEIKYVGGTPKGIRLKPPFKPTAKDFERALDHQLMVAILLNSPNNPTGAIMDEEELKKLAKNIKATDGHHGPRKPMAVIEDRLYKDIVYDPRYPARSIVSVDPDFKGRTLIADGISKTFNATGLRIGWVAGPQDLIDKATSILGLIPGNANSVFQYATFFALTKYKKETDRELETFLRRHKRRRDLVYRELHRVFGLQMCRPEGAFYGWVSVEELIGRGKKYASSKEWAGALLERKLVGVIPGEEFDYPGYIRLNTAVTMGNLKKGVQRIKEFAGETIKENKREAEKQKKEQERQEQEQQRLK